MICKMYADGIVNGEVCAPPSKSTAHRAILAAALCDGDCRVDNVALSADIKATLQAARVLGRDFEYKDGAVFFKGKKSVDKAQIDCNESGSTLRFLIPICAALGVQTTFSGQGKLPQRPYDILADVMSRHGVCFDKKSGLPLTIQGRLQSGVYQIAGDVSSQYITGLLYALPLAEGDSSIVLTSALQSKGYVDMTIDTLSKFGIQIQATEQGYDIKGGQKYKSTDFTVEGDYSNAAFWLVMGALNNGIAVKGLSQNSLQGDRAIVDILRRMGAQVAQTDDTVYVGKSRLKGIDIDVGQIPDLAPILSVALACADGTGRILNAARLKIKESDRLRAINDNLAAVGVKTLLGDDSVVVYGGNIKGGGAQGFNDHRIVMSMAALATVSKNAITVSDAQAVEKSYPDFFEIYKKLGGHADVIDLG